MGRHNEESSSDYARKYPALARRRTPKSPAWHKRAADRVLAGYDENSRSVYLTDTERLTHHLSVGTTGSGKTTEMKSLVMQDFLRGLGGLVIDPHGAHEGSLYAELLAELHRLGFFATGRVHLIDLTAREFVSPINPLARLNGTDVSVIADALLTAFERAWGDEDTHAKPTIRTVLKATFAALAELDLPLADAKLLYDPHDRAGLRARTITLLTNEYAIDVLERLHQVALDDRTKKEFNAQIVGPINRLNEFVSSDVLAAMFGVTDEPGGPRRTLDLLEIMDRGHLLLVNLQHGASVSEANANLVGAVLVRYLLLLAPRRTNREPFFVTIDEAHRFLTGDDIPDALAELRKFGVGLHMGLQYLRQAGTRDDLMYQALMNCTEIKTVLRVKSPEEAQTLAEYVMPLSLERPVQASIRPTAIGQRRVRLATNSVGRTRSTSRGYSESEGETHALTRMHSHSEGVGAMTAVSTGEGSFDGVTDSSGVMLTPPMALFGPNAPTASMIPTALSQSEGKANARGSSRQSARSSATSRISVESTGEAQSVARSKAQTRSISETDGTTRTAGESEGFETLYADLPASFHGKEAELYFLGEEIRALPTGQAFLSTRGRTHRITIPKPKRQS